MLLMMDQHLLLADVTPRTSTCSAVLPRKDNACPPDFLSPSMAEVAHKP